MTTTISEPSRETDMIHRCDGLVVGLGPGGLAAALAAARRSVSVAGAVAAHSVNSNVRLRNVDIAAVQHELVRQGVKIS